MKITILTKKNPPTPVVIKIKCPNPNAKALIITDKLTFRPKMFRLIVFKGFKIFKRKLAHCIDKMCVVIGKTKIHTSLFK